MSVENADKPLSAKLRNYLCQCGLIVIVIAFIGFYLFLELSLSFPLSPLLDPYLAIVGAVTALILIIIVCPICVIIAFIHDRRTQALMQSSASTPKHSGTRVPPQQVLANCPTCGALLQGGEQFCSSCGVALPDSSD